MNLEKLVAMQQELDAHITKEKGLEETGNTSWKTLALVVEIGELANNWRGFKKWSNDQKPRIAVTRYERHGEPPVTRNLLLEEYVDCLSFFLSIANEKGWQESLYIHQEAVLDIQREGFQGGLTGAFNEMTYLLLKSYMEIDRDEKIEQYFAITKQEFNFKSAWFLFVAIGLVGFKFTEEQIEEAYMNKNAVNHTRQENGY
ncbi:dUTP diphosphatase [Pseudobacillus sp. FSL P4-0506]|uniref:dUTP diphosphatase n=1 Tax=Pseudobacillus sp. FSL P4-0506 TaxID=2921576 RepID=UPI0030FC5F6C